MPTSLDPQPAENEIECARCGAIFYYELSRCPKCGVNLYEPDEGSDPNPPAFKPHPSGLSARIANFFRRLGGKPHPAEELFDRSLRSAALHSDLLRKLGGDRQAVERLVAFEQARLPQAGRLTWLQNAIRHWEKDNQ